MKTPPPSTPRAASGRPTGHARRALTRHWVASLALALATAIAVPAVGAAPATTAPILQGTPAATQSARRDSPADAPRQAARSRAALAAPGQTSLKFDDKARRATLTVDDGYDLDQYLFADESPIDFQIDLQGLDPNPPGGQPARLHLGVYDVDQAGGYSCGPEVDKVSVNGRNVGQLTGANNSSSVNTFTLPAGTLNSKINSFQVAIDTSDTGCWAVEVASAWIELPFNIGQTAADAIDDVAIRRGATNDVIPDRIWASDFDSAGALNAPNPDDPIADAMSDSHWLGSNTTGSFTYKYTIGAWPKKPEWAPTVTATWQFSGPAGGLAQTEEPKTGWEGQLKILVPQQTGKYRLTVRLKIAKEETLLRPEERQHDVYVLLGEPQSMGTRDRMQAGNVPIDTETPKTAWLDQAFQWGADGQSAAHPILKALTNSIYGNPKNWIYAASGWNTSVELLEGTGNRGECNTFAGVWQILALSLGIDAETGDYYPGFFGVGVESVFLTSNQRALDQNVSANVDRKGGAERERWAFQKHSWGVYNGIRYDPTFGVIEPDTDAALEVSTIFCDKEGFANADESWFCRQLAAPASRFLVRPKPGRPTNDAGWRLWVYEPAATPLRPAPGRARTVLPQATGVPSDNGIDADGNGQFEQLRLDLPVEVASAGTYTVLATLSTSSGSYVADGRLNAVERSTHEVQITLPSGTATLPVYFSGRAIRVAGVDGPYVADVRVVGEDGTVIGTTRHATRPYGHLSFQGLLASVGAITDSSVNTHGVSGDDVLRINVPLTASGTGPIEVHAQLFSGDTRLGTVDRDINLTSSQTLALDFATTPLWAAGIDGPYTVFVSVDDAFYGAQHRHTTVAYHAAAFQPPAGYVLPAVTDQGQDSDGNGRYDSLDVTASVAATTAGSYTLDGTLVASSGAVIASTNLVVAASATPTNLALRFDGREIARLGADGPYDLALSLTDAVGVRQMVRTHRTKGYRAAEFEQPPAILGGTYTDSAVDTNGDGHPDVLRVEAGINVEQAGTYTLSGALFDSAGSLVAQASASEPLTVGPGTVRLDFEGADIQARGVDGPYRLSGMELSLTGTGVVDTALDVHQTAAYEARQFRPRGPFFIERVEDQGSDTDANGLFDQLLVNVTVVVHTAGSYNANARLVDPCGQEIEWSSTTAMLDAGEHVLSIPFDGRRIAGHGVGGPYRVENLSVYDEADVEHGITLTDAHTTKAYTAQQFEPAGIVVGHVTAHGSPLAEAVVAVGGVAYASTDLSGSYRLVIPQSGTLVISITADPGLAPWQILVNGAPQSPGSSATIQVSVGATTTVDWSSP
jgi:hypothetical protein